MGTIIKAEAFVSLEESMARTLGAAGPKDDHQLSELIKMVEAGRFGEAHAFVDQMVFPRLDGTHLGKIEELGVSALLFGAHHAAGDLQSVSIGLDGVPAEVGQAISQLDHLVTHDAPDLIRDRLHDVIRAFETQQHEIAHYAKDDVSGDDLERDGGMQNPEQGSKGKPKKVVRSSIRYVTTGELMALAKEDVRTLYVYRPLLNAQELIAWAKGVGFETTLTADDMHVTVAYSKEPVDRSSLSPLPDVVTSRGGMRAVHRFGKAVVLQFEDSDLHSRWSFFRRHGASWDFEGYRSHVTISWQAPDLDLEKLQPFQGDLMFGPEEFEEIDENWKAGVIEKAEAVKKTVAQQLNDAVLGTGRMMMDVGANITTSRLVTFGFLAEAVSKGIDRYEVNEVLDAKTCPLCRFMHGKVFDVKREHARVQTALATVDPNELRSIAPWPSASKANLARLKGMTTAQMQAAGIGSPPFHPGCRGFPVRIGNTVPIVEETAPSAPDAIDILNDPVGSAYKALARLVNGTSKLTDGEVAVLDEYVGNLYASLNSVLRHGTKDPELKAYLAPKRRAMDKAVRKGSLPAWTVLYRGVRQPQQVLGVNSLSEAVGSAFVDKGFMSTTTDLGRAQSYAEAGVGGAVLELKVPAGIHAIAPDLIEGVLTSAEYELVLQRGLQFYVSGVTDDGSIPVIHATIVSPVRKAEQDAEPITLAAGGNRFVYEPGDIQRV